MENKIIKVAFFDLDSTLTDGIYQVSSEGIVTKSFYARDFYGLYKLQDLGIDVCILTNSNDGCIQKQNEKLPKVFKSRLVVRENVKDKKTYIEAGFKKYKITFDNVVYMGDDENDLDCMRLSGITGCPVDAIEEIKAESNFISDYPGGKGAVRDFVEYLIGLSDKGIITIT